MTIAGAALLESRAWLRRAAKVCGAVVVVLTVLLVADGIAERRRASKETALIGYLEEVSLTDASIAPELAAERELQTERSVTRQARNRRLGWALLVATGLFLAAAKRVQALGGRPLMTSGDQLVAMDLVSLGTGNALSPGAAAGPASAAGGSGPPSPDLDFVDEVVVREGTGREAAIPILQELQKRYRYLPEAALRRVCELTEVTPADLVGVASFYSQFRSTPVGRHLVRICHGTACHVAGIGPITDELRRRLEIPESGDSDAEMRFTLDPVNCLGCCSLAPVMMVDDHVAGRLTPMSACEVLAHAESTAEAEA